MLRRTCNVTGRKFALPDWTDDTPEIGYYAENHFGFRMACGLIDAHAEYNGAFYLQGMLRHKAIMACKDISEERLRFPHTPI